MNRRNFVKSAAAGIASLFFTPIAKSQDKQSKWWTEQHSTFDGYPITYYDWPKDRLICMTNSNNETDTVWVPAFALSELSNEERDINLQIRNVINSAKSQDQDFSHIYLFKIDGDGDECQYAILAWIDAHPTLDYFGPHLSARKSRKYRLKSKWTKS